MASLPLKNSTDVNNNHLFSVIIPTYHRNDLLAKCLDCLAPGVQTLSAEQYEVIVTDDGSQTTAEEMIRQQYPWAKWVAGPRKGP
ncbi:MAG: glycosyltransferase family 2 protein, partial [Nostoc sp.]